MDYGRPIGQREIKPTFGFNFSFGGKSGGTIKRKPTRVPTGQKSSENTPTSSGTPPLQTSSPNGNQSTKNGGKGRSGRRQLFQSNNEENESDVEMVVHVSPPPRKVAAVIISERSCFRKTEDGDDDDEGSKSAVGISGVSSGASKKSKKVENDDGRIMRQKNKKDKSNAYHGTGKAAKKRRRRIESSPEPHHRQQSSEENESDVEMVVHASPPPRNVAAVISSERSSFRKTEDGDDEGRRSAVGISGVSSGASKKSKKVENGDGRIKRRKNKKDKNIAYHDIGNAAKDRRGRIESSPEPHHRQKSSDENESDVEMVVHGSPPPRNIAAVISSERSNFRKTEDGDDDDEGSRSVVGISGVSSGASKKSKKGENDDGRIKRQKTKKDKSNAYHGSGNAHKKKRERDEVDPDPHHRQISSSCFVRLPKYPHPNVLPPSSAQESGILLENREHNKPQLRQKKNVNLTSSFDDASNSEQADEIVSRHNKKRMNDGKSKHGKSKLERSKKENIQSQLVEIGDGDSDEKNKVKKRRMDQVILISDAEDDLNLISNETVVTPPLDPDATATAFPELSEVDDTANNREFRSPLITNNDDFRLPQKPSRSRPMPLSKKLTREKRKAEKDKRRERISADDSTPSSCLSFSVNSDNSVTFIPSSPVARNDIEVIEVKEEEVEEASSRSPVPSSTGNANTVEDGNEYEMVVELVIDEKVQDYLKLQNADPTNLVDVPVELLKNCAGTLKDDALEMGGAELVFPGVRLVGSYVVPNTIRTGYVQIDAKTLAPLSMYDDRTLIFVVVKGFVVVKSAASYYWRAGSAETAYLHGEKFGVGKTIIIKKNTIYSLENWEEEPLLLAFTDISEASGVATSNSLSIS